MLIVVFFWSHRREKFCVHVNVNLSGDNNNCVHREEAMSTPGDPRDGQSKMSTPRDTRGAQSQMITPTYTREPLGDITNVIGMLKICTYANLFIFFTIYWKDVFIFLDEESRRREQRNMQQRKRRADMSMEQRGEINRKQLEYRERKKHATQNSSTSAALRETVPLTSASSIGI